ncbi:MULTISPECIES: DUF421 domain-containing protein [unclassified Acinetobacter]|uniref:DUF421 domain-containing protein n=1 Tax=unclassified Acinetobacter TaxID=196816 RepID=UPI0029341CA0|nr:MULTISPECIES: YetF domain-containing protein [unclassified Acinetobacter]WOE32566.1 DUF421 domain-containing protein [Acinetobacter sp. SAAs470]WOE38041.1 DUF421 domain-containing protein [Acinetobacter sp. SAAs474]
MFYAFLLFKLIIGFLIVIAHLNYSGKTQLSQLTPIDFIGNFILGGIIGGIIYNDNITLLQYIIVLLLGVFLISLFNYITKKFDIVQQITVGDPIPIIENGRFIIENIKKNKNKIDILNISSLIHAQGITSFQQVAYAQIEPNGQLTVTLDQQQVPSKILVSNGCIKKIALEQIQQDQVWLVEQITAMGLKLENIYLLEYCYRGLFAVDHDGITHWINLEHSVPVSHISIDYHL